MRVKLERSFEFKIYPTFSPSFVWDVNGKTGFLMKRSLIILRWKIIISI